MKRKRKTLKAGVHSDFPQGVVGNLHPHSLFFKPTPLHLKPNLFSFSLLHRPQEQKPGLRPRFCLGINLFLPFSSSYNQPKHGHLWSLDGCQVLSGFRQTIHSHSGMFAAFFSQITGIQMYVSSLYNRTTSVYRSTQITVSHLMFFGQKASLQRRKILGKDLEID